MLYIWHSLFFFFGAEVALNVCILVLLTAIFQLKGMSIQFITPNELMREYQPLHTQYSIPIEITNIDHQGTVWINYALNIPGN